MHIKRFEAPSLPDAIRQVKAELGPDALVLSQRTVRRDGGWFGLGGRAVVEVMAAVERDRERPDRRDPVADDPGWRQLQMLRSLVDPLEGELRSLRHGFESMATTLQEREALAADLRAIRRLLAERGEGPGEDLAAHARPLAAGLIRAGVEPRHAAAAARRAESRGGEGGNTDAASLQRALAATLDARVVPPHPGDEVDTELFVGPTGAGKTTTLAKLAARPAARGDRVRVVTTDAQRLGADGLLRGCARRIGVPFDVVASPRALREALGRDRSGRVLVDTAGRSPGDARAIGELAEIRRALGARVRVHLVLAAPTKEEDLRGALHRYLPLAPDGLVLTKLDESANLANVVNLLLDDDAPRLRWVTDGQRIPEDLHVPDPEGLAERVVAAAA